MLTPHSNSCQQMTKSPALSVLYEAGSLHGNGHICMETCTQERVCSFTAHHTSAVERKLKYSPAVNHESPAHVCLNNSGKTNKCTQKNGDFFYFTDTDCFQMYCKYKFNLYLPIDHQQKSAGSQEAMKKKESKHIISWLQQDIRKTSCYNLILWGFISARLSRECTSWKVAGLFFITLGTTLLYGSLEKILSSSIMLWDCPEQDPNISTSL